MIPEADSLELRVLVVAPTRRDGEITCELLERQGLSCVVLRRVQDVTEQLSQGVGLIILTDTSLNDPEIRGLVEEVQRQPSWSDIPLLLLARDKTSAPLAVYALDSLTNVTLLDRPSSTRVMVSAVQAALRARRRQYQIRDQLIAQQQAEEALRKADQRKDEFLATLAHELRNPLAAIRTGLEIAARSVGEPTRTQRVVGMIDRQSRMLVKLIDDLMDVSRIATGKVVLEREQVDLRSVIETSLEGGQTVFNASSHDFSLELPVEPVWVTGDATRLAQVIGNLVHNAGKYTPDGGRISVTLHQEGEEAVVRVSDTGVGIEPQLLEQVFEMFAQVDRTMDRARGGLGIGLSLVRRLIELHGGSVKAHSQGHGQGSEFVVRLPLAGGTPLDSVATGPPHPDSATALKVLVIDDNQDAADGLAALIESDGHDTRTAYDGQTGLHEAQAFQPDIIFCDIGMPGMNGHEVATRHRASPQGNATLLIALTGWGTAEDKQQSSAAGFDLHFTKPISIEEIESVFARF